MKVCLDAGHGMSNEKQGVYDYGTGKKTLAEADITLQWALTGAWILTQYGMEVYLTRTDSVTPIPVEDRAKMAMDAGCDCMISIHVNENQGNQSGVEGFYRDAGDYDFASKVFSALQQATGLPNRGLKDETQGENKGNRFAVLDFVPPATLIEIGFIDNPVDVAVITSGLTRVKFFDLLASNLLAGKVY